MKRIYKYASILILAVPALIFSACLKNDDLVTENAKEGGAVSPTSSIAYLVNATPKVDIVLNVLKGPGIKSIEVYNQYLRREDNKYSNKVLMKTIEVNSANLSDDLDQNYSITYADLVKGVTVGGAALPSDENLMPIGDSWTLTYVSVMEDGRKVYNNETTQIDISNQWTGSYLLSGYIVREGDDGKLQGAYKNVPWKLATNGKRTVVYWKTHQWRDGSTVGGIGPWILTIDDSGGQNNPMPVTVTDPINPAVKNNPAYNNRYEPSSKTFFISVYWGSGPTNRAATDTLVYSGPY